MKEAEIATNLKSCDYRDLTSEEILLLSEKLLPLILSKIEKQIDEWEERKMQIEEVAVKLCLKL